MGWYLKRAGARLGEGSPGAQFLGGVLLWFLGAFLAVGSYRRLSLALVHLPLPLRVVATALALKPLFSFRLLVEEVREVEAALDSSLEEARERLTYLLVSRDSSTLSDVEVRGAALESLAENLSDSVIAPLLWFLVLGLPGAALYRYANTADAIWGYRGAWEWRGKWAARTDDVMNWGPARLTALTLGWETPFVRLRCEARKTESPNAGWPMAALALKLGVRLAKPGAYTLNPGGREPAKEDVWKALAHVQCVGWLAATLLAGLAVLSAALEVKTEQQAQW
jgi:adenosylcobinamide-phosphate synthase